MKKIIAAFLVAVIIMAGLPASVFAAPEGEELNSYLLELSWSQQQLENYLDEYELTLDDFEDTEDLRWFLGDLLTPETLDEVLQEFEINEEEARAFLVSGGELQKGQSLYDGFKFADDLYFALYLISLTPVTDEAIDELLKEFQLTYEELEALFAEYDDDLTYYEYMEDLYDVTEYYLSGPEEYYGEDEDFYDLFAMIGLTDDELDRLFDHFLTLDLENEAFWLKLEELTERMLAFEDFEEADEMTPEMITELLDIFTQLLDVLEMETSLYLVKGEESKETSLSALAAMTTTDGYDLLIELYNTEGVFLADLLFTADMLGSEIIQETGGDLQEAEEVLEQTETSGKAVPELQVSAQKIEFHDKEEKKQAVIKEAALEGTVIGDRLPDTASHHLYSLLAGLFIMLSGAVLYRSSRKKRETA